jgi:O-succinylbenzoate synthase
MRSALIGADAQSSLANHEPSERFVRIERIDVRLIKLPLRFPFETSFGVSTHKEFLLVSVHSGGVAGHAECVADVDPFYLPETNVTALHVIKEFLAPVALGADLEHPRELLPLFSRVRGHPMAKAALEMAAYELVARQQGVPLYRVLGGRGGEIQSGVSIGLQHDVGALVAKVDEEIAAGYRRIKIKIKPGKDAKLVAAVRARHPDVPLMVDANSAYHIEDAPLFKALDPYGLMMIEQPLAWDDIVEHARLQKQITTPVCLDESIHSPEDARHALAIGACRIINVKVGRVGGFTNAATIADDCRRAGVPVWSGGMLESGIGRLHNVHLQTLPGFTLPGDTSASARYFEHDLIDPPVRVSDRGTIVVPDKPGIGHEILWDRVDAATHHRESLG